MLSSDDQVGDRTGEAMAVAEEFLQVDDIQGNVLRGFNTAVLDLIGLKIAGTGARTWIASLADDIDSVSSTHGYRLQRSFAPEATAESVQINAAFSARGLKNLGMPVDSVKDGFFQSPMGALAGSLGDPVVAGKPSGYRLGTDWDDTPDLLLLVGGESQTAVAQAGDALIVAAKAAGLELCYHESGAKLPGDVEHFGFRDGISQPGVRGRLSAKADDFLTPRLLVPDDANFGRFSKPGQQLVWPGQFVFGYATQLPHDPFSLGPKSTGGAAWMENGSFLVFRRLGQDVPRFQAFASELASSLTRITGRNVNAEYAAALVVGRWPDGTPLLADGTGPNPTISGDDMLVNFFSYAGGPDRLNIRDGGALRTVSSAPADPKGLSCPMFAHIRKVNPRGLPTDQDTIPDQTLTMQMLRRGIPFGPKYTGNNAGDCRGLFFLAYMTSIQRQFARLNRVWMNNSGAPEMHDEGFDMLVGQAAKGDRFLTMRDAQGNEILRLPSADNWVLPTGGAFLFAPSISFFRNLALTS